MMFFFGVKKERKNLWGNASPKPRRPWRSGARGQLGLRIKRGFVKFGTNPLSFYSCPRVISPSRLATPRPLWRNLVYLHKHKTNVKCEMNSSALHLNT